MYNFDRFNQPLAREYRNNADGSNSNGNDEDTDGLTVESGDWYTCEDCGTILMPGDGVVFDRQHNAYCDCSCRRHALANGKRQERDRKYTREMMRKEA
jgi:ribosomal protein L24E